MMKGQIKEQQKDLPAAKDAYIEGVRVIIYTSSSSVVKVHHILKSMPVSHLHLRCISPPWLIEILMVKCPRLYIL